MDTVKYDRQIRLFGMDTQERLSEQTVQVLGGPSYIACEIVKNVVLLGVRKLIAEEATVAKTKELVPDDLCALNERLEITVCSRIAECDFLFLVGGEDVSYAEVDPLDGKITDEMVTPAGTPPPPFYFVCSECYLIQKNRTAHACTEGGIGALEPRGGLISDELTSLALDCIAGAFVVQEYIKCVEGRGDAVDSYRLRF